MIPLLAVLGAVLAQNPAQNPAPCKVLAPDAQDALIAAPANHTVLYETADVRVLDVHSSGHTREAFHTHALPSVMYIDSQGPGRYMTPTDPNERVRKDDPNFKFRIIAIPGNEPLHATENTGDVPFHAIRVEFKHPGCSLDPSQPQAQPRPDDALKAAPSGHTLLFENDDVRVLDVHLAPHTREPMHTHPWNGFFYIIQASDMKYFTPTITDPNVRRAGTNVPKIVSVAAEGPHSVENLGDVEMHFIRFELKHATPAAR